MVCMFPASVVSGMKEAQEKLTGDAFKQGHTGDELWGGRDGRRAVRATLPPPEPELHSYSPKRSLIKLLHSGLSLTELNQANH